MDPEHRRNGDVPIEWIHARPHVQPSPSQRRRDKFMNSEIVLVYSERVQGFSDL